MTLRILPDLFGIARFDPSEPIPPAIYKSSFFNITKTDDELSVVANLESLEKHDKVEPDWRILMVQGPLDFSLTGILSKLAKPLADAGISIFAISTFDTDYLMVKQSTLNNAVRTLEEAGFQFSK